MWLRSDSAELSPVPTATSVSRLPECGVITSFNFVITEFTTCLRSSARLIRMTPAPMPGVGIDRAVLLGEMLGRDVTGILDFEVVHTVDPLAGGAARFRGRWRIR